MKKCSVKRKFAAAAVLGVLAIGTAALTGCRGKETQIEEPEPMAKEAEFTFWQYGGADDLGDPEDVGTMIMDCDSLSYFNTITNSTVTSKSGKYVQGTGALAISSLLNTATCSGTFADVDISDYTDGSVHVSLYVSDPDYFSDVLVVELTSSGKYDEEEICWKVPSGLLNAGWNDLYLSISDGVLTGDPNFAAINFFRVYTVNAKLGLDVILDNVYATAAPGMSLETTASKLATTKTGYLMDFDTLMGLSSTGTLSLSTAEGEYKEGAAGIVVLNPTSVWVLANLQTVDLSAYSRGTISFWVYVNNAAYVKGSTITVEISSSGVPDKNELSWTISGDTLKTGWNEVTLSLSSGKSTPDAIDLAKVNFFRIFSLDCDPGLQVILDAVSYNQAVTRIPGDGMILSCDTDDAMEIKTKNTFSITTAASEHKEGTGAFKVTGSDIIWFQAQLRELVDVSKYASGGLHLWVYVSDSDKLESNLCIELGSGGNYDVDEYQWNVGGLESGWNELELSFASATATGSPDLSNINWFRVYAPNTGSLTGIVDDVRAIYIEEKEAVLGMIMDCDSTGGMTVQSNNKFSITRTEGEYKEGSAAFKSVGSANVWWQTKLGVPVDVSAYADGGIHMWLYVSDSSKLSGNVSVELGSGGIYDVEEYQWNISGLATGWNELVLRFSDISQRTSDGGADLTRINWFRVFGTRTGEITAILDDVRAVEVEPEDPGDPDDPGTETVENLLISCDNKTGYTMESANAFAVTTKEDEHREGSGAFKTEGTGQIWYRFRDFAEALDVSAYDGVSFWLYIDDVSRINGKLTVELTSSGGPDVEELQWALTAGVDLTNGWNEVVLYFDEAAKKGVTDLSAINFIRIFQGGGGSSGTITTILDCICGVTREAGGEEPAETRIQIASCDVKDNSTLFEVNVGSGVLSVTNTEGEYKEGSGAYKTTLSSQVVIQFRNFVTMPDISSCEGGGIQFWLYIEDVSRINGGLNVEIGNGGTGGAGHDSSEYEWKNISGLTSGWNQVTLYFENATKNGTVDLAKINWFRIYQSGGAASGSCTFIVDDLCAVAPAEAVTTAQTVSGASALAILKTVEQTVMEVKTAVAAGTTVLAGAPVLESERNETVLEAFIGSGLYGSPVWRRYSDRSCHNS